jgi:Fe-Mn family superoxide dismutase
MKHTLPSTPYNYAALEPHVDARTMMLHHGRHHASYVANLNTALQPFPELHERTALWLLLNLDRVPEQARKTVRNNAGGHVNHSLFWRAMSPATRGAPRGPLADAIDCDFGSLERFKARLRGSGRQPLRVGWVWLTREREGSGRLQVCTTSGHDNPLMQGQFPILVNDAWEHAYYLRHENQRDDYLRDWWAVANWEEAGAAVRTSGSRCG